MERTPMANITAYETSRGQKRFRVRFRKPDGTQTDKRGFVRKKDAELWAAEHVTVAMVKGAYVDPQAGKVTVGSLWSAWLAKKQVTSKPSYIESLERAWRVHVEPKWGARSLGSITRGEVQEWATSMAQAKSATVVIRNVGILSSICADAVADMLIVRNPCEGLSLPRKRRKPHAYLSASELFALADASGGRRTMVLVMGLCGLRWGEMAGLHVEDVDFARMRLDVRRSATEVGGVVRVDVPKNGEWRQVAFPDLLLVPLREACGGRDGGDVLFPAADGGYVRRMHGPNDDSSWFFWAKRRAGIGKPLTFHDLRHTAASLMVSAGANVKAVQRQLGHKSAAMTLDVYADLFDDDLDAVTNAMNGLLVRENVGKMWAKEQEAAA